MVRGTKTGAKGRGGGEEVSINDARGAARQKVNSSEGTTFATLFQRDSVPSFRISFFFFCGGDGRVVPLLRAGDEVIYIEPDGHSDAGTARLLQ